MKFFADSAFARELRHEVAGALDREGRAGYPPVGDARLQRKGWLVSAWFMLGYALLLTAQSPIWAVCAGLFQGAAAACLGLTVFHDAGHGAMARRRWVNLAIVRLCCVALGPARYFWELKHHHLHHRAPNVHGWDDDVDARGWLRLTPQEPWAMRHARQHLRAPVLYALNTIEWFFLKDFLCLFRRQLNRWQRVEPNRQEIREFWLTKALWLLLFVSPPFLLLPLPWAAVAFLAYHCVFSLCLTLVFQLAHLSPDMAFCGLRPGDDHATHQVRTTANFALESRAVAWLTGGLNYQIEHHLFPGVAHTHYPAIAPIVAAAARRHGLPYHDLGSFSDAVRTHFAFLRTLGVRPHS